MQSSTEPTNFLMTRECQGISTSTLRNILAERSRLEETFVRHTAAVYRAIRAAIIPLVDGKEAFRLFQKIQGIVDYGEEHDDCENLLRPLMGQDEGASSLQETLATPLGGLIKDHLCGLRHLKEMIKKMAREQNSETLSKTSQPATVPATLRTFRKKPEPPPSESDRAVLQTEAYRTALYRESKKLISVKQKLEAQLKLSKDVVRRLLRIARASLSTLSAIPSQGSFSSDPDDRSSGSDVDQSTGMKFSSTKVGPWPLEWVLEERSLQQQQQQLKQQRQPVDYDIFLATSIKKSKKSKKSDSPLFTESTETRITKLAEEIKTDEPSPRDLRVSSPDIEVIQLSHGDNITNNTDKRATNPAHVSAMFDVYVRAWRTYEAESDVELSLYEGMKIKQKAPANEDGLAYGWTRKSRVSRKKYGFYPASHVVLDDDKKLFKFANGFGDCA